MKCDEAAEFVSALCDGEMVSPDIAKHIGECELCRSRLNAYAQMGAEVRRLACLEQPIAMKARSWNNETKVWLNWWRKRSTTMRVPRLAFALMLLLIFLLSGSVVLVRARGGNTGAVLLLTFKVPPNGPVFDDCVITTDGNPKTSHCGYATATGVGEVASMLGFDVRFVSRDGDRTQLVARAKLKPHTNTFYFVDDLKDVTQTPIWIEPRQQPARIPVPGLGEIEVSGDYLDHMPALRFRPKETLDPQKDEFRVVSPVLIRGNEVLFNLGGSNSIDSADPEATLMMYYPGKGRYLVSIVPFDGAVEGSVEPGQIKFNLDGQDYLLLTAMPTTLSPHVWVSHDAQYKLSEHMQDASDDQPMFMVRNLKKLLQPRIPHIM